MSPAGFCRNHPERPATGICVACRTSICGECVTKVQGINYCSACLTKRPGSRRPRSSAGSPPLVALGLLLSFGATWTAFYLLGVLFAKF